MKRMLMLASVASMIDQFNIPNIKLLQSMGYEVDVACNFVEGNTCSDEQIERLKILLDSMQVKYYQIDFTRNVMNLKQEFVAYKQVKELLQQKKYDFVHCHSPIGGVVGRLVGARVFTKVIYTGHGFHFFKGASWVNWAIYFPIEWICSWMTEVLITINQEDYQRAKKSLHAKRVIYLPGIGVDTQKFRQDDDMREQKRRELGVESDQVMLLSVGELSKRKNQEVVIRAVAKVNNPNIKYFICGQGSYYEKYEKLIEELGLKEQVYLLGFRRDISELCQATDIYMFPSLQEGLPVALMEAMSCGLPCIASDIRGNNDLIQNEVGGYLIKATDVDEYAHKIDDLCKDIKLREHMRENNLKTIQQYDVSIIQGRMLEIYKNM